MTKPYPNFGAKLAETLTLLRALHHPDAGALIAAHLEQIERPEPSPQIPLLRESDHA